MLRRIGTTLFAVTMLCAMSYPVMRSVLTGEPSQDSFPLSDYPMFSYGRHDTAMNITQALGVKGDTRTPLSPLVASGNREVLQSLMTILNHVQAGRQDTFCREVAGRVLAEGLDYEAVELATSRFETVEYFDPTSSHFHAPVSRSTHARCPVRP